MEIILPFDVIAIAISKLFVLGALGYFLYFKKVIDDNFLNGLSMLLVKVIFPCLIVYQTISHFSYERFENWWVLPIFGAGVSLVGIFAGLLFNRVFLKINSEKEFIFSTGFQNCGYLPIVLIRFAFDGAVRERLLIFVILFIVGFNLLVWSLGPLFLAGEFKKKFSLSKLFNPPIIATMIALLWIFFCPGVKVHPLLMDPIKEIGRCAFPFSMVCLGGYLARYGVFLPKERLALATAIAIKLFLFPVIMFFILKIIPMDKDLRFFLFLESLMPTAVSLVVIGSYTGADNKWFSSMIFYTHLIAIFVVPLWLCVYHIISG